ncbi:MAG: hypothetical protein K2I69_05330 [Muribaculaceae bacterium]|nr:hypothetical protein [Muribaculaceae bacterium]
MKTKIFNLIIIDESGSMQPLVKATVSGCNETINTIISSQEQFAETQENFVSVYVFQGGTAIPSRYLYFNVPAQNIAPVTEEQYRPLGNTPLYDAIGMSVGALQEHMKEYSQAIASVTIITDGYENSSTEFNSRSIAAMIDKLKKKGWNFNFIGANIDAEQVADTLNIDNSLSFVATPGGTKEMWSIFSECRSIYGTRIHEIFTQDIDDDEDEDTFEERCSKAADNFF